MDNQNFTITLLIDQTAKKVFDAINNVDGWWTKIEGSSQNLNDVFTVHFGETFITHKIIEFNPNKKVLWRVTDSSVKEWLDTKICFEISDKNNSTEIKFTHIGMVPSLKEYNDCAKGWTRFINENLFKLITKTTKTIEEIAARFNELAQQEKWFEIQDELFGDNVKSIEPPNSPYFGYAEGKATIRKKGEDFVSRVESVHKAYTTKPVIAGNHFAVGREVDITHKVHGRIQINQIMLYEVNDGQIILEQFFY